MATYYFSTKDFGVTDTGIHLLRSGFNYETIMFSQINKMEIKKAKELNNWFLILIIGMILLTPGFYIAITIISSFFDEGVSVRSARIIYFLFMPLIGGFFVYTSLQSGTVLKINYGQDKSDKLSLREILKSNQIDDFKLLMRAKVNVKLREE